MIDTTIFHIYDKATNEPVKVCLTVEELEQLIAARSIDWKQWEVEPCYTEYGVRMHRSEIKSLKFLRDLRKTYDATPSTRFPSTPSKISINTHLLGVDGFSALLYTKYMNKC